MMLRLLVWILRDCRRAAAGRLQLPRSRSCSLERPSWSTTRPPRRRSSIPTAKPRRRRSVLRKPSPLATGRDAPPEYWELSLTRGDATGTGQFQGAQRRRRAGAAIAGQRADHRRAGDHRDRSAVRRRGHAKRVRSGGFRVKSNFDRQSSGRSTTSSSAAARASCSKTRRSMQTAITKRTAFGGTFGLHQEHGLRRQQCAGQLVSARLEHQLGKLGFRQSWLQGGGAEFNRIYGPPNVPGVFSGVPGFANGVLVARINTDISLTDFEIGVRDLVSNVENAYWDLYFAYRDLDAKIAARDSALETWRRDSRAVRHRPPRRRGRKRGRGPRAVFPLSGRSANRLVRAVGGGHVGRSTAAAAARSAASSGVRVAERRLRMLLALPINECKLIRPCDEPRRAKVIFEWCEMLTEALARRVELRRQKWVIKRRELELIGSKNFLLPTFDTSAMYRVRGLWREPDRLQQRHQRQSLRQRVAKPVHAASSRNGKPVSSFRCRWASAADTPPCAMPSCSWPANGRSSQQQEREIALRSQQCHVRGRAGVRLHVDAATTAAWPPSSIWRRSRAAFEADKAQSELVLDSQRRLAEAEIRYFGSLVEYALAIKNMHFEKGSLLDYNDVYLAEGPWPGKAYGDAAERAAMRRPERELNYTFLRQPIQVSAGQYGQITPPSVEPPPGVVPASATAPIDNRAPGNPLPGNVPPVNNGPTASSRAPGQRSAPARSGTTGQRCTGLEQPRVADGHRIEADRGAAGAGDQAEHRCRRAHNSQINWRLPHCRRRPCRPAPLPPPSAAPPAQRAPQNGAADWGAHHRPPICRPPKNCCRRACGPSRRAARRLLRTTVGRESHIEQIADGVDRQVRSRIIGHCIGIQRVMPLPGKNGGDAVLPNLLDGRQNSHLVVHEHVTPGRIAGFDVL